MTTTPGYEPERRKESTRKKRRGRKDLSVSPTIRLVEREEKSYILVTLGAA